MTQCIFLTIFSAIAHLPLSLADEMKDSAPLAPTAKAELKSKSGSKAKGQVQFTESSDGLQVRYQFSGLGKNQKHGFHIHEKGDCSSRDAKSAGPHYKKMEDGGGTSADTPDRHAGDMPQIESDGQGKAEGVFLLSQGGLSKTSSVKGRALILHGGPDDLSKPSAPRIACGVIVEQKIH